jgi:hypothetical protein
MSYVHIQFLLGVTDIMTSQNIDVSSCGILYVLSTNVT